MSYCFVEGHPEIRFELGECALEELVFHDIYMAMFETDPDIFFSEYDKAGTTIFENKECQFWELFDVMLPKFKFSARSCSLIIVIE